MKKIALSVLLFYVVSSISAQSLNLHKMKHKDVFQTIHYALEGNIEFGLYPLYFEINNLRKNKVKSVRYQRTDSSAFKPYAAEGYVEFNAFGDIISHYLNDFCSDQDTLNEVILNMKYDQKGRVSELFHKIYYVQDTFYFEYKSSYFLIYHKNESGEISEDLELEYNRLENSFGVLSSTYIERKHIDVDGGYKRTMHLDSNGFLIKINYSPFDCQLYCRQTYGVETTFEYKNTDISYVTENTTLQEMSPISKDIVRRWKVNRNNQGLVTKIACESEKISWTFQYEYY